MKHKMPVWGWFTVSCGMLLLLCVGTWAQAKEKRKLLRVGVYDSRAITIAYSGSRHNDAFMVKKSREKQKAEAAGDLDKAKKIDTWMTYFKIQRHAQGFSTAPVHDLLACVKEEIPTIAREAGVDLIVSKWEFDFRSLDAEVLDVTRQLVQAYKPKKKVLSSIEQFVRSKPVSHAEIIQHELERGH